MYISPSRNYEDMAKKNMHNEGVSVEYGCHWCQRSSLMKNEMTWHVWWCDMCDEVVKSYDDVLVLSWSHFYNLTPLCKDMENCRNSENWPSIGKS